MTLINEIAPSADATALEGQDLVPGEPNQVQHTNSEVTGFSKIQLEILEPLLDAVMCSYFPIMFSAPSIPNMTRVCIRQLKLPDGYLGFSNGKDHIWLCRTLDRVEARCTLIHELIHLKHGHNKQPKDSECEVEKVTAETLIRFDDLMKVATWTESLWEAADYLLVDLSTLEDRIKYLSPEEKSSLKSVAHPSWWEATT